MLVREIKSPGSKTLGNVSPVGYHRVDPSVGSSWSDAPLVSNYALLSNHFIQSLERL